MTRQLPSSTILEILDFKRCRIMTGPPCLERPTKEAFTRRAESSQSIDATDERRAIKSGLY
jgi:hypothetical protein